MENLCSAGTCPISQISWLWYAIAVIVSFGIGGLWYGVIFFKKWAEAVSFKCECKADFSKGEKCSCPPKATYIFTLSMQFIATAIIGLMYFVLTPISIGLSLLVLVAVCGWMKASLKFQIDQWKRFVTLATIDVGYFFVVSVTMILFALL